MAFSNGVSVLRRSWLSCSVCVARGQAMTLELASVSGLLNTASAQHTRLRVALAPSQMSCGQLLSESSVEMANMAARNATQASATPHRSQPVETGFNHSQQGSLHVHSQKGHPLPSCPTDSCPDYTPENMACGLMSALQPGCLCSDLSPANCVWPSACDRTSL